jgi:MFS family permease
VADVYSRRLSIIIGYILMGLGFLVEGFFPAFIPILLTQVVWGLGYTFTSGATQAWISDEIGEDDANKLFLRATQIGLFASLIGMGLATLVGANSVVMPLRVGAFGVMLIGITLAVIMPETGFHPTPREDRTTWGHMWHTFKQGADTVRAYVYSVLRALASGRRKGNCQGRRRLAEFLEFDQVLQKWYGLLTTGRQNAAQDRMGLRSFFCSIAAICFSSNHRWA